MVHLQAAFSLAEARPRNAHCARVREDASRPDHPLADRCRATVRSRRIRTEPCRSNTSPSAFVPGVPDARLAVTRGAICAIMTHEFQ